MQTDYWKVLKFVVNNMRISLCIPSYTINKHLEELTIRCALSVRDQVDQLIISEDFGMFSPELYKLSDLYILGKYNVGFSKNVNRAWRNADGDFVIILNSDTELLKGNLSDLCIEGRVTSPLIANQEIPYLAGPCWCAPREVTKKYGYLNEEMRTYASDSDYDHRVRHIFKKVSSVKFYHEMMQSVKAAGVEGGEEQRRDNEIYQRLKEEGKAK